MKAMLSLGDVVDKLSILSMKIYFGDEASIAEHRYLEKSLTAYGVNGKVVTQVIRMTLMNRLIWEMENEMRKDAREMEELSIEDLAIDGKRARKIRDFNRKRIEYKNILNEISRGFREIKIQHRSQ
jgi:hypothetical protein